MRSTFDRRRLLTGAVLGGATVLGATALGSLAPETAFAAQNVAQVLDGPDPNFAEGRVSTVSGSQLLVTGSDGTLHRIHVTGGTSIWKLQPTTFDQVAVGDGLYARGVRLGDGTLAADALWVNIVNLHADIVKIGVFGDNGTLTIGGGMISANTLLKLYAPGSNGIIDFVANVTLNSQGASALCESAPLLTRTVRCGVNSGQKKATRPSADTNVRATVARGRNRTARRCVRIVDVAVIRPALCGRRSR